MTITISNIVGKIKVKKSDGEVYDYTGYELYEGDELKLRKGSSCTVSYDSKDINITSSYIIDSTDIEQSKPKKKIKKATVKKISDSEINISVPTA